MTQDQVRLYWGDLHNHNEIGYGQGTLERSYTLARTGLDFYAFTPHSWWPDIPDSNPTIKEYHQKGFARVRERWSLIRNTANELNKAGRFVALLAYEWHSSAWGDYCIYFPDDQGELFYAATLNELKTFAASRRALIIPHHPAYPKENRGTNWDTVDTANSPVAEVFSEHGNSLEPSSHLNMYRHSMGGTQYSQCIALQLVKGLKLGFVAGTDDHYGYPGSYGEGLTGVLAQELSRESILKAIRERHTYAVTGDRINLWFQIGPGMMGDILPHTEPREVQIKVTAQDEIDYVELVKNGRTCQKWSPTTIPDSGNEVLTVRVEWGWGGMTSKEKTQWQIHLSTKDGRFTAATPLFCGGPDLIGDLNWLEFDSERQLAIQSYTCRTNFLPTHTAVVRFTGDTLELSAAGQWSGLSFNNSVKLSRSHLIANDTYFPINPAFAAPLVKVHRGLEPAAVNFTKEWIDQEAGKGDFYYVKVMQKNGQMAWSSPIWFE